MRIQALFLVMAMSLPFDARAADLAKSTELMQTMSAHEISAGLVKAAMRKQKAAGSLSAEQLACVEAIPASSYHSVVAGAIADGMSDAEVAEALVFFRTPVGRKVLALMTSKFDGKPAPSPLAPEDRASLAAFQATPAGNKIFTKNIPLGSDTVTSKTHAITTSAIDNCGATTAPK